MLTLRICIFENSLDPDKLASDEKPADQDPHCNPLCLLHAQVNNWNQMLMRSVVQKINIVRVKDVFYFSGEMDLWLTYMKQHR